MPAPRPSLRLYCTKDLGSRPGPWLQAEVPCPRWGRTLQPLPPKRGSLGPLTSPRSRDPRVRAFTPSAWRPGSLDPESLL